MTDFILRFYLGFLNLFIKIDGIVTCYMAAKFKRQLCVNY